MPAYGDVTRATPFFGSSCNERKRLLEELMGHAKKLLRRTSLHRSIDYSYSSSEAEAEADPNKYKS